MKIRIKIWGSNLDSINYLVNEILKLVEQLGIEKKGPIYLPTKVLRVPSMRTLGKRGTKIYETYQLRIYRRIIDVSLDERFMKNLLKIQIPKDTKISLRIIKE